MVREGPRAYNAFQPGENQELKKTPSGISHIFSEAPSKIDTGYGGEVSPRYISPIISKETLSPVSLEFAGVRSPRGTDG